MKRFIVASLFTAVSVSSFAVTLVDIKLDQQINIGLGDAIYSQANANLTFVNDGSVKFARSTVVASGWWYSPRINFLFAGIGAISIADPTTALSADLRVYQDAVANSNPFKDANVFLRVYDSSLNYRDFGIIYGPDMTGNPDKYPNWIRPTVYLNDKAKSNYTDSSASFDVNNIVQMRFYGTDWNLKTGMTGDYMDAKNLKIETVPEPATMAVLGLGALALIKRRRK